MSGCATLRVTPLYSGNRVAVYFVDRDGTGLRCRANMAHSRESRPDSGPGFQVKALKMSCHVGSSLGSGTRPGFGRRTGGTRARTRRVEGLGASAHSDATGSSTRSARAPEVLDTRI